MSIVLQDTKTNTVLYKPYAKLDSGSAQANNELSLHEFESMAKSKPDYALKFIQDYTGQSSIKDYITKFVEIYKGNSQTLSTLFNLKTSTGYAFIFNKDSPLLVKCDSAARTLCNQCVAGRSPNAMPGDYFDKSAATRFEESISPEFKEYKFSPQDLSNLKVGRQTVNGSPMYTLFLNGKSIGSSYRDNVIYDFIVKQCEAKGEVSKDSPYASTYLNAKALFLQENVADLADYLSAPSKKELQTLFQQFPDPKLYNNPTLRLLRMSTEGGLSIYGISKKEDLTPDKLQAAFSQIYQDIKDVLGTGIHPSSVSDICEKVSNILQKDYGINQTQLQQLFAQAVKAGFDTPLGRIGFGIGDSDKFKMEAELRSLKLLPPIGEIPPPFDFGNFMKELGLMAANTVKKTIPAIMMSSPIIGLTYQTLGKDTSVDNFVYQDIQMLDYFNTPKSDTPYSVPGQKGTKPTGYELDAFSALSMGEFSSIDSQKMINQLLFREYTDQGVKDKVKAFLTQFTKWVPPEQRDVKVFYFTGADGKKTPVLLIGGKAQDGQFYYMDPSTGKSIKGATRDTVFQYFCKNNSLPGHGQISFLNEDGKLIIFTTKADAISDGLASLNAFASIGAMATIFIPGLGEVSLALFATSLGSGIASKFYNKEPWTAQEVISTVIQGMLIGGSGGAALLKAALKTADKAMIVKVFEVIGKTGFGLMMTEMSVEGFQALYTKSPEKFFNLLLNIGLLVAAYKAQKFGNTPKAVQKYQELGFTPKTGDTAAVFVARCSDEIKHKRIEELADLGKKPFNPSGNITKELAGAGAIKDLLQKFILKSKTNLIKSLSSEQKVPFIIKVIKELAGIKPVSDMEMKTLVSDSMPLMTRFFSGCLSKLNRLPEMKAILLKKNPDLFSVSDKPTASQKIALVKYKTEIDRGVVVLQDKLQRIITNSGYKKFSAVNVRAKDAVGILDKISRMRNGNAGRDIRPDYTLGDMPDALGGRITIESISDLPMIMKGLETTFGKDNIIEVDNFYLSPTKSQRPYRVITYTILVDNGNGVKIPCEIQVTTLKASVMADLDHDGIYKGIVLTTEAEKQLIKNLHNAAVTSEIQEVQKSINTQK